MARSATRHVGRSLSQLQTFSIADHPITEGGYYLDENRVLMLEHPALSRRSMARNHP